MKSSYSKGKWTTEPHGNTTALYCDRDEEHHGLRLMNLDDGDSNFDANVRLITSAPDMLEILIEYVEWGAKTQSDRDYFERQFKNLIKSATGELS